MFALSALTSLLLLQYIARRFGDLVGRGLSWQVITEFFLLSIPFTLAMTVPPQTREQGGALVVGQSAKQRDLRQTCRGCLRIRALHFVLSPQFVGQLYSGRGDL